MNAIRRQFGQFAVSGFLLHASHGTASVFRAAPVPSVALHPLVAQVQRVADALAAVGAPLTADDLHELHQAVFAPEESNGVARIASVLDKRALMEMRINPEARNAHDVTVAAQVCARLDAEPDARLKTIASASPYSKPYCHVGRPRIAGTKRVPVELIVNGHAVARTEVEADRNVHSVSSTHRVERSSWIALSIYLSSHTNPAWVTVADAPVRASRRSATWCRRAVDVCWEQKRLRIRAQELRAAISVYDHARETYDRIIKESFRDGADVNSVSISLIFPVT